MLSVDKHLETHIVHACNLACEGCSHFSGNGHRGVVSLTDYQNWTASWAYRLRPLSFRILGGEPTIHPHLTDVIRLTGEMWPETKLYFTTNGFFIHRHPELGKALGKAKFTGVKISIHSKEPVYTAKIKDNVELMKRWSKDYGFALDVADDAGWSRVYHGKGADVSPFTDGDQRKSWQSCFVKQYPQLLGGRIYKCPLTAYIKVQRASLGVSEAWKLAVDYAGISPLASDAQVLKFFATQDESVCSLCPSSRHMFDKPLPFRSQK